MYIGKAKNTNYSNRNNIHQKNEEITNSQQWMTPKEWKQQTRAQIFLNQDSALLSFFPALNI